MVAAGAFVDVVIEREQKDHLELTELMPLLADIDVFKTDIATAFVFGTLSIQSHQIDVPDTLHVTIAIKSHHLGCATFGGKKREEPGIAPDIEHSPAQHEGQRDCRELRAHSLRRLITSPVIALNSQIENAPPIRAKRS
jgi:hypothetical protein